MKFPRSLTQKLRSRIADGTIRSLRSNEVEIDFFSNDYLGFSRNKAIDQKYLSSLKELDFPNGSTGSRLISGNFQIHENTEGDLAVFFQAEAALLFNSGYDANLGLLSAILQRNDCVFYDRLAHASIRDGIQLSKASSFGFDHNDLDDLKKKVKKAKSLNGHNYLVVESVYSMDGDEAPLDELANFCQENDLYLIVDEAHATGVFGKQGRGLVSELGLERMVFARVHTFGKALGCHGAVVLGSEDLRNYLVNFSRSFIYTTAMPPAEVLRIRSAFDELQVTDQMDKLHKIIQVFVSRVSELDLTIHFIKSRSPIQSYILSDPKRTDEINKVLSYEKIGAKVILAPTVPNGQERIRICLHSFNSSQEVDRILQLLSTFV